MRILQISIETHDARQIDIKQAAGGATAKYHDLYEPADRRFEFFVEVGTNQTAEERFGAATKIACEVYGKAKNGKPNATNSMIHDVWRVLDQVAGA